MSLLQKFIQMKDKAGFACPITPDICVDQERLLEIVTPRYLTDGTLCSS